MRENIFDYLKEYGFSTEEIYFFQEVNDKLFFVDKSLIITNIEFFESKGLSSLEIITMIKNKPYLLTIGFRKRELLDKIYNEFFDKEELKNLIVKYTSSYIVNPLELSKKLESSLNKKEMIITYLSEH